MNYFKLLLLSATLTLTACDKAYNGPNAIAGKGVAHLASDLSWFSTTEVKTIDGKVVFSIYPGVGSNNVAPGTHNVTLYTEHAFYSKSATLRATFKPNQNYRARSSINNGVLKLWIEDQYGRLASNVYATNNPDSAPIHREEMVQMLNAPYITGR